MKQKHADLLEEPYIELMQNSSPKVDAASLLPATYAPNPEQVAVGRVDSVQFYRGRGCETVVLHEPEGVYFQNLLELGGGTCFRGLKD